MVPGTSSVFVKEEVGKGGHKGGQKGEGGQLRTPRLHRSFPNEMAKPCPVRRGRVWHESAASAIYCQLIKLAFVISQRGRAGLCQDRWRMKEIFLPFELFMARNFTCENLSRLGGGSRRRILSSLKAAEHMVWVPREGQESANDDRRPRREWHY